MSPADVGGPSGPFFEAVSGAALTAAAMLGVAFWLDSSAPAPPLPFLLLFALIAAGLVVALAAALIGLPLTWLLARGGREAPWAYPAAGGVAGGALMAGFFRIGWADASRPAAEWAQIASLGAVPGFVCGALWWILYRRHFQPGRAG